MEKDHTFTDLSADLLDQMYSLIILPEEYNISEYYLYI